MHTLFPLGKLYLSDNSTKWKALGPCKTTLTNRIEFNIFLCISIFVFFCIYCGVLGSSLARFGVMCFAFCCARQYFSTHIFSGFSLHTNTCAIEIQYKIHRRNGDDLIDEMIRGKGSRESGEGRAMRCCKSVFQVAP